MKDYMEIASAPYDEPCAQVGADNYSELAHKECNALIGQLRRELGEEPGTARLRIKANPHDFGTYYEVACYYDDEDEEGMAYAFKCESDCPGTWDKIARKELGLKKGGD